MLIDLQTVLALRMSEEPELVEGSTLPLVISCAPLNDWENMREFAVKFNTKVNYQRNQLAFGIVAEVISGCLARHFELAIPNFSLVEITNAFRESVASNPHTLANVLEVVNQNVHNYNFGSEIIKLETTSPLPLQVYSQAQLEAAAQVFAFDALIYNADRTEENPNLWSIEDKFFVYDHEKAFNFVFDEQIGYEAQGEFRTPDGKSFVHGHIFHPMLRKKGLGFEEFTDRLHNLSDQVIENAVEGVPYQMRREFDLEISRVISHLKTTRDNPDAFRLNLTEVLL